MINLNPNSFCIIIISLWHLSPTLPIHRFTSLNSLYICNEIPPIPAMPYGCELIFHACLRIQVCYGYPFASSRKFQPLEALHCILHCCSIFHANEPEAKLPQLLNSCDWRKWWISHNHMEKSERNHSRKIPFITAVPCGSPFVFHWMLEFSSSTELAIFGLRINLAHPRHKFWILQPSTVFQSIEMHRVKPQFI